MKAQALSLNSTRLGQKALMAITGIVWFGYVFVHMLGNLQIYLGAERINAYRALLHSLPGPLWVARAIIASALLVHIINGVRLSAKNKDARPVEYKQRKDTRTNFAARTMIWGGVTIAFFLVFHILHLTLGFNPSDQPFDEENLYANLINGFSVPYVSIIYIVAQVALGLHLYHGIWSLFQTLGLNHPKYNAWRRHFATAFALIVAIGNISIPVSVLTGFLTL